MSVGEDSLYSIKPLLERHWATMDPSIDLIDLVALNGYKRALLSRPHFRQIGVSTSNTRVRFHIALIWSRIFNITHEHMELDPSTKGVVDNIPRIRPVSIGNRWRLRVRITRPKAGHTVKVIT